MSRYQYFDHCPANRTLDNIIVKQSNYVPEQGTSLLQSCDISFGPTHALPPWAAGGLVHERERVFVPPPQVTLHSLQFPQAVQPPFTEEKKKMIVAIMCTVEKLLIVFLPGHIVSLLQSCVISFKPRQVFPPWAAGGLVHERKRVFVPPPHDTLHLLQFPQAVQPPSTLIWDKTITIIIAIHQFDRFFQINL